MAIFKIEIERNMDDAECCIKLGGSIYALAFGDTAEEATKLALVKARKRIRDNRLPAAEHIAVMRADMAKLLRKAG